MRTALVFFVLVLLVLCSFVTVVVDYRPGDCKECKV